MQSQRNKWEGPGFSNSNLKKTAGVRLRSPAHTEHILRVRNVTRGVTLGDQVTVADTSAKRRTGLLKHASLEPGEGLWIVPCEGVHTWGMNFPIDVVFLNRKRTVVKIRKDMGRRRMAICLWGHSVLELPAGTLESTGTQKGDQLEFDKP